MTLDLYSHLLTDSLDRATDLMAQGLAAAETDADASSDESDEPTDEGEGS